MTAAIRKSCWLVVALLVLGSFEPICGHEEANKVAGNYDELPREQLKEVAKLGGAFREIQSVVGQEKNNFNPEMSMETVRAMQKKSDWAFGLLNGKLNDALKIFTSLTLLNNKEFCNHKGYEILAKNFALSSGSGDGLTFSSSMLYHYARQHAIECLPRYGKKFLWESNAVGILQTLKQLNKSFRGLQLEDFSPEVQEEESGNELELTNQKGIAFVEANLNSFDIRASGLEKILSNMGLKAGQPADNQAATIKTIIEGNLLMPCGAYVDRMKDIFAPAKIDLFMSRTGKQVPPPEFSEKFLIGWQSYRICLYFDRADRRDLLSRFLQALEIGA